MNVVEVDWFSMARRLSQANIPWDDRFKDLGAKKASKVRGDLFGQRRALVIHRKHDALDGKIWVQSPSDPHQRVQKF
jgi:hypothetical protein